MLEGQILYTWRIHLPEQVIDEMRVDMAGGDSIVDRSNDDGRKREDLIAARQERSKE